MNSTPTDRYPLFAIHPITDRTHWNRIASDPKFTPLLTDLRKLLDTLPPRPAMPHATDYLAAKRSNDRARLDDLWQVGRSHLSALCFDRCLKGIDPADSDDRLLDWLFAHLTHPTWVVSAHLPGNDLPASAAPQLDLAACEMAANLAETREALKPWMDTVSSTLADSIITEIDRRVLEPFVRLRHTWWFDKSRDEMHNWVGVCAGSILAACQSLAAQGHPRPEARDWALQCLRDFVAKGFTPHGECDEGVHYWSYGMGFACVGWSRLSQAELAANVNMDHLRRIADYPHRAHLFDNFFFAGNDAGSTFSAPLYFAPWLAAACELPWLASFAARYPDPMHRNFSMLCRVAFALEIPPASAPLPADEWPRLHEDQQAGLFRVPTPAGDLIACLTGGHNAERHNHNDLGHFLLAFNNQSIIPDLGAPHYTTDFFGPRRYTYLAASSRGHNCPLINNQEQRPGRDAASRILEWNPTIPRLTLDLTAAYPADANLLSWTRTLQTHSSSVAITDTFRARPHTPIVHTLWSLYAPQPAGPGAFKLATILCQFTPTPTDLKITPINADDHHLREFPHQTLYRIEATYTTADTDSLTLQTTLFAST